MLCAVLCAAAVQEYDPFLVSLLSCIIVGMLCITCAKRKYSKMRNAQKRERAAQKAEDTMRTALEAQKKALELKKQGMNYPVKWTKDPRNVQEVEEPDGTKKQVQMPVEGLVPVPQNTSEYWDVYDELTRAPDARFKQSNGQKSDLHGMHDAWITKLERIQNTDLYTNNDTMREKLKRSNKAESKEVRGWYGTGNFDAANIYMDKQDGFMMQFASAGQWARGLYFADEAGYSDLYASAAAGMPDGGESRGFQNDEKEMMLATLLLGNVIEMDRDQPPLLKACSKLKTPPAIAGCQDKTKPCPHDGVPTCTAPPTQAPGHKYNTVRGYTQTDKRHPDGTWTKNPACPRSKVWIVYENGRAYPQYLVRYYRGAFDPRRVGQFNSRAAAGAGVGAEQAATARRQAPPTQQRLVPPLHAAAVPASFCHFAVDGIKSVYSAEDNALIARARSRCAAFTGALSPPLYRWYRAARSLAR